MSTSTTQKPTTRRIVGMLVGIVIIGLGIALFKQRSEEHTSELQSL